MSISPFRVDQNTPDISNLDAESKAEKAEVEQVEDVLNQTPYQPKELRSGGILNWLQKKNPSPQFLADVAKMNETELDPRKVKHVERKIDLLIMPALAICYMFYYVDKTTLSYAAIFDLKNDLHLGSSDYNWLSSLFYFGWLGWALPTNLLMQKFPLNKYLAFNLLLHDPRINPCVIDRIFQIFLWGVLLMAQAASRNFTELAVLRVLSGAAEATADPAFVLITGTWYTRTQQPTRIGYWYLANGFGIALGGLFGYAIGHIKGSLSSWKYEFIIIGALCSAWAIFMAIFVPDSPYFSHWFTPEERLIIVSRKRGDHNSTDTREWKPAQVLEAFIDPKTYLFFLFGFTANVPNGATSNFGTLIVQGFGFDTFQTTLMQIPYGMVIVAFILAAIFINAKLPPGYRTLLMALTNVPTVVGFAMVAWCKGTAPRLAGFWLTGASNATFVLGLSLLSGNVGGQSKKAIASAAVFLGVAIGNIVGPFLFKTSEAPTYYTGVVGCLVSRALEIVIILILRVIFIVSNRRKDRFVAKGHVRYDGRSTELEDITDWKNPAFRYVT